MTKQTNQHRSTQMNTETMQPPLIEKIDALLDQLKAPKIPTHKELWDTKEVASFLRVKPAKFSRNIGCLPTFPKPRNIDPNTTNATNHRWVAGEVMSWANAQKVH